MSFTAFMERRRAQNKKKETVFDRRKKFLASLGNRAKDVETDEGAGRKSSRRKAKG